MLNQSQFETLPMAVEAESRQWLACYANLAKVACPGQAVSYNQEITAAIRDIDQILPKERAFLATRP